MDPVTAIAAAVGQIFSFAGTVTQNKGARDAAILNDAATWNPYLMPKAKDYTLLIIVGILGIVLLVVLLVVALRKK